MLCSPANINGPDAVELEEHWMGCEHYRMVGNTWGLLQTKRMPKQTVMEIHIINTLNNFVLALLGHCDHLFISDILGTRRF